MKNRIVNNYSCFVSALIAGAFYLFVCFYYKIFPFGTDYTLLKIDLCHQYAPMLTQMYDLVKSGSSITYSWASGLGYSFFGNFINYLASPFNLIIFLFKRENIVNSISIIILLKTLFISGFFSYYLSKTFKRSDAVNVAFSLLYTFSGWFVAYNWNIMWLDVLFCLPLAALGVQRIIDEKKPALYITVLSYSMLTNYYMSYMLCIFLCIYFIYWYVLNNEIKKDFSVGFFKSNFFKSGVGFILSSVASAGVSAVVLVPIYYLLRSSSATGDSFNKGLKFYFDFFSFWAQQFSGSSPVVQTGTTRNIPNAWCGMLVILLIPVYFLSKKFSKKERITDFCLLGFLVFSLSFNALSFVWHGFHFANGLEDRFAYFYVFAALTVAFKAIDKIRDMNKYFIIASCALACIFIVIMHFAVPEYVEKYTVLISIGFTVVWLIMYFISGMEKPDKSLLKFVALFLVCLELVFSTLSDFDYNLAKYHFNGEYDNFSRVTAKINAGENELFYRIEKTNTQNCMEPMVLGYNGVTNFSSVTRESVAKNQSALGVDSNKINSYIYFLQTPVYNSIFGLKYIVDADNSVKNKGYGKLLFDESGYSVYKNSYYLPLCYCVDSKLAEFESEIETNPFYQQNRMFELMSGCKNVFSYCPVLKFNSQNCSAEKEETEKTQTAVITANLENKEKSGLVEYVFDLNAGEDYYIYLSYKQARNNIELIGLEEEIMTEKAHSVGTKVLNSVIPIGEQKNDTTLTVRVPVDGKNDGKQIAVYVASLNKEIFNSGYSLLNRNTLKLTEFDNTHFKGTVTAEDDCLLFTSIPYDRGWHITIDGKQVDENSVIAVDGAYISVPLTKGEHTVEFNYFPCGLKAGIIVSSVSVCAFVAYLIINKKKKK